MRGLPAAYRREQQENSSETLRKRAE